MLFCNVVTIIVPFACFIFRFTKTVKIPGRFYAWKWILIFEPKIETIEQIIQNIKIFSVYLGSRHRAILLEIIQQTFPGVHRSWHNTGIHRTQKDIKSVVYWTYWFIWYKLSTSFLTKCETCLILNFVFGRTAIWASADNISIGKK